MTDVSEYAPRAQHTLLVRKKLSTRMHLLIYLEVSDRVADSFNPTTCQSRLFLKAMRLGFVLEAHYTAAVGSYYQLVQD